MSDVLLRLRRDLTRSITVGVNAGGGAANVGYDDSPSYGSLSDNTFKGEIIGSIRAFDNGAGLQNFRIEIDNDTVPDDFFTKLSIETVHLGEIDLTAATASVSTSAGNWKAWTWTTTPDMYWRVEDEAEVLSWGIN